MTSPPGSMSGRQLYAFAHPALARRFYLALVFSIVLFPLIALGLVVGTVVLALPLIALLLWISSRVLFARLLGNAILVSQLNYPRIDAIAQQMKIRMGYKKPIFIFVYEHGTFNAYMRFIFLRRAIFLNSELLEAGVGDDEVRWLVGRFVGYLRIRQETGIFGWIIRAAEYLVVFNMFLMPHERAMVYTGDRLALAAIDGDVASAISAMQKLIVGRQLGYSVNPEGLIEQHRQVKGSFFAFLARLMSRFPMMTSRYVDLIVFAKLFFPARFASFEAANPGLPADLLRLAAGRQPSPDIPADRLHASGRPPRAWICSGATALVLIGAGFLVWSATLRTIADASAAQPAATVPVAAAPAALPPHVHRSASGQLAPDTGCTWLSAAPDDFRVRCN